MKGRFVCQLAHPGHFTVCPQDAKPLAQTGGWDDGAAVRGKYRVLCKIGQGGMGAAHVLGMAHRDIQPDNLFLLAGPEGEHVKVLDFGIAELEQASLANAKRIARS